MKCMNLVIDDFYHAHAHSLRLLCVEECGTSVTSSQAGDYALTRTGRPEEGRTGDVTRPMTAEVTESIENGSVTVNNNQMRKTVPDQVTGDYKTEMTAMSLETP